jgi:hypothetical protein
MGMSSSAIDSPIPALLMRTSSLPCVALTTSEVAASIDAEDVTSNASVVTFEFDFRHSGIFDGVRAVAKTW